jgi:hypothetical protein
MLLVAHGLISVRRYTENCREKEDKNVERKGVEEEVENHSEKI